MVNPDVLFPQSSNTAELIMTPQESATILLVEILMSGTSGKVAGVKWATFTASGIGYLRRFCMAPSVVSSFVLCTPALAPINMQQLIYFTIKIQFINSAMNVWIDLQAALATSDAR